MKWEVGKTVSEERTQYERKIAAMESDHHQKLLDTERQNTNLIAELQARLKEVTSDCTILARENDSLKEVMAKKDAEVNEMLSQQAMNQSDFYTKA